jgi:hypothetical protein
VVTSQIEVAVAGDLPHRVATPALGLADDDDTGHLPLYLPVSLTARLTPAQVGSLFAPNSRRTPRRRVPDIDTPAHIFFLFAELRYIVIW